MIIIEVKAASFSEHYDSYDMRYRRCVVRASRRKISPSVENDRMGLSWSFREMQRAWRKSYSAEKRRCQRRKRCQEPLSHLDSETNRLTPSRLRITFSDVRWNGQADPLGGWAIHFDRSSDLCRNGTCKGLVLYVSCATINSFLSRFLIWDCFT